MALLELGRTSRKPLCISPKTLPLADAVKQLKLLHATSQLAGSLMMRPAIETDDDRLIIAARQPASSGLSWSHLAGAEHPCEPHTRLA